MGQFAVFSVGTKQVITFGIVAKYASTICNILGLAIYAGPRH